jgi:hypothetical protein
MFSKKYVFVVGAGASAEFGMPTGAEMKTKVGESLNFDRNQRGLIIGDRDIFDMLGNRFGAESSRYQEGATELAARIKEFESIDEALHWLSASPELVLLGKVAIVRYILQAERESKLYKQPESDRYNESWLPSFVSMALGSQTREQSNNGFRNATIINFNYDRTIEQFLFHWLQFNFGLSLEEAKAAIKSLNILRPYGSVGFLPWQEGGGVPFGDQIGMNHEKLFSVSKNILTFTEQALSDQLKSEITLAMDNADYVVFLGFGFHQQNMSIIRATKATQWRRSLATVFQIDPENFESLKRQIAITVGLDNFAKAQVLPRRSAHLLQSMRPSLMGVQ